MELAGAREFGAFAMPTDEGVQVGWSDPNGIEDSKVRQVSAQSFAADTRSKDEKSLRDTEAAWSKAAATKDVDRIVSYYADDASVFPANAPIAKSKDEIKKLWSGPVGAPGPRSRGKPPLRSRRRARGASRSLACRCTPACKEKPSRKGVFEGLLR